MAQKFNIDQKVFVICEKISSEKCPTCGHNYDLRKKTVSEGTIVGMSKNIQTGHLFYEVRVGNAHYFYKEDNIYSHVTDLEEVLN